MSIKGINKPNFFILGAAKSGSSSMYEYLKKHPDIFLANPKEPTFFNEGFQVVKNPIKYFELYDSVSTEHIIGEASHAYLTNPSTAKILKALFPDSYFLVILRNPADRAYSLYHHMRRQGFEYINTFEKALEAEERRYTSKNFMVNRRENFYNYLYFRSGLYGEQLKNYFSIFPKKQFHIIKFEQFIANPQTHFKQIFQFLDVNPDIEFEFEVHNAGKMTARFPQVQYLVTTKIAKLRLIRRLLLKILKVVNRINIPPLQQETRALLLSKYTTDLQQLYEMTGISFFDQKESQQSGQP